VRISAKTDYAVRAAVELAGAPDGSVIKAERIAEAQDIPLKFLENILIELRHDGLVRSQRGPDGGYWLARPAAEIAVGDVIRAVEGPLASVRGEAPEGLAYSGSANALQTVWVALRANLRGVLDEVTLADVVAGELPAAVAALADDPDAWVRR
jgi:Rrf2 family protein